MSAVVIDGGVVHYEYLGRGAPVVFVHGWLGSWRYWMATMGDLSDAYRTYALDLWGFGDTDKLQDRYNLTEYVQLMLEFMDELGISRIPMFVGHSLGALIALDIAVTRPEMIERLALISLPLDKQHIDAKSLMNGRGVFGGGILGGGLFKKATEYEPVTREVDKTDLQAIELSLSSLDGIDVPAKLSALQVPTLVLHGARDSIVTSSQDSLSPGLESLTQQSKVVRAMIMPQSRHFPMLEEANIFNRLLRDFLLMDLSSPENIQSLQFKEEWRRRMR